jgi:hypothetical protein
LIRLRLLDPATESSVDAFLLDHPAVKNFISAKRAAAVSGQIEAVESPPQLARNLLIENEEGRNESHF